jgi:hypothetical protein
VQFVTIRSGAYGFKTAMEMPNAKTQKPFAYTVTDVIMTLLSLETFLIVSYI